MNSRLRFALILVLASISAARAETPGDFAYRIPLVTEGAGPFFRLALPPSVYEGAVRSDAGDLRVFNHDGQVVPYAYLPAPTQAKEKLPPRALPVFPLRIEERRPDFGDLSMSVRKGPSGMQVDITTREGQPVEAQRLAGYLIDASEVDVPITAITLPLPPSANLTTRARLEASDDLAGWQTLAAGAPLIALEFDNRRLARDRIEFAPLRARYFRLSFDDGVPAVDLAQVYAETGERALESRRDWREVPGVNDGDKPLDFVYDAGGRFPVDRVTLVLAESNTIAPAQIYARNAPTEPWRAVGAGVFYHLRERGADVDNPPLAIDAGAARYWRVRINPNAGLPERSAPMLRLGWLPPQIVFAARGSPPFDLAFGSRLAQPGALRIDTLVPGFDAAKGLPASAGVAHVADLAPERGNRGSNLPPVANPGALKEPIDWKRWVLWGTLLLAVVALGLMALSLSKRLDTSSQAAAPPRDEPRN